MAFHAQQVQRVGILRRRLELRPEQLAQVAVAGFQLLFFPIVGELIEVEDIAVEFQHRESCPGSARLLDRPVLHDEPRARGGLRQHAAFGDVGRGPLRVAIVVHEDAANMTVRRKLADKHGQSVRRGVEGAFVQHRGTDVGADVEHRALHRALAERHQVKAAQIGGEHHRDGGDHHRNAELHLAVAGRLHDDEFAVRVQLVQAVKGAGEKAERQDDDQQARQHQQREIHEGRRRLSAVDHQIEQAERLRQPHHAGQQEAEQRDRSRELAQDIVRQVRQLRWHS